MAKITVKGKPHRISQREAKEACNFFCKFLMKTRLSNLLYIELVFIDNFYKDTKCYADMTWTDDDSRVPRDFHVRVDASLSRIPILKALAHEMVHVKQYARNELKDLTRNLRKRWNRQVYEDNTPYMECPWEIEARSLEEPLYKEWVYYRRMIRYGDKSRQHARVARTHRKNC